MAIARAILCPLCVDATSQPLTECVPTATDIAFAIAGLDGFNAHGAGFLSAARELGVTPDLVTATSGQIVVLGERLRGTDLRTLLIDPSQPGGPLGTLLTACTGDPGIFRPAIPEYWQRWSRWPTTPSDLAAAVFPAQEYVPLRSEAYLGGIAGLLNGAPFGVVFNAYDRGSERERCSATRPPARCGPADRCSRSPARRSRRPSGCRFTGSRGFPGA